MYWVRSWADLFDCGFFICILGRVSVCAIWLRAGRVLRFSAIHGYRVLILCTRVFFVGHAFVVYPGKDGVGPLASARISFL